MDTGDAVSGIIFDIQRYSLHDGPGIRTIPFFKGCPMRCKWCCNPESFTVEPQTMTIFGKPTQVGREITVGELMEIVLKDKIYYRRSKGGVTLSGGEPAFQPDFAKNLLMACKQKYIHTAIETCAYADYDAYEALFPYLDLLLVDIKHMSNEKHREFTGVPNELILRNVRRFAEYPGLEMIVRVPVVPKFNDTVAEISEIAAFASSLPKVQQIHLLPYHRLGEEKYRGLGKEYPYAGVTPISNETMTSLREAAALVSGLHCQIGG